jgi:peptidoglycan/LPS O-acetylase OafA/YrhL
MVVVLHTHIPFAPEQKAQLLWWPGFSDLGWMGVDLFFVISGFIIAHVLSKPGVDLKDYFWRRFWRIYPLYWIVMIVALLCYLRWNWFGYGIETLGASGMVKSFLIFPMEPHPFWEPGWSLEHELIFYIIAALVAPFFGLRVLAAVMIGLGAVGLAFDMGWDFHLFARPQLLFGAGVCAYLMRERSMAAALPVALAGLVLCYAHYYELADMPQWVADIATATGFAGLVVLGVGLERRGWRVPRPMIAIGNASFSLYLWHLLVFPFVGRYAQALGASPEVWRWMLAGAAIGIALLSYRYIEKPIIAFSHRPLARTRPVAAE